MTTHTELAAQARQAFENLLDKYWGLAYAEGVQGRNHDTESGEAQKALNELMELWDRRAALESTERLAGGGEPKPVGVLHEEALGRGVVFWFAKPPDGSNLYTTPPPQAERVPLSDEQCDAIYLALDRWAKGIDSYDFGLPMVGGGGAQGARPVIRDAAHGITPKEGT